jgi:hypothetical protein
MSTPFSVLAVLGTAMLFASCTSTTVAPSEFGRASDRPLPTASASPGSRPSLAPTLGTAPPKPPAASGTIEPANFTNAVDNPWFPLTPGTSLTYQGTKDGKKAVERFTVTSATKIIDGVTCVVVEDRISLGGVAAEKLLGYYAQDRAGTVWYFGEDTQELDANGQVVSTEGSWRAGVDKAPPALFMEASPTVGHSFAHDYTKNDFANLSLTDKVTVPYGSFIDVLVTKEWSPLEPDIETHKYYVRGVGAVRDVAVKGPTEEFVLVKVEHS